MAEGNLVVNFDTTILALFSEVTTFEKMPGEFQVPYLVHDVCMQQDKLETMRQNVLVVVQKYNELKNDLSPEEQRLFTDHRRKLDRRLGQGLSRLSWAKKNLVDRYVGRALLLLLLLLLLLPLLHY